MGKRISFLIKNQSFELRVRDKTLRPIYLLVNKYMVTHTYHYDYKKKKRIKILDKEFFIKKHRGLYIYHISIIRKVIAVVGNMHVRRHEIDISYEKTTFHTHIDFSILDKFKPRPYQLPFIQTLTADDCAGSVLVDLPPGKGKTYIAVKTIHDLKTRAGILVLPKYIDKWNADFTKYTGIPPGEVSTIQGLGSLEGYLNGTTPVGDFVIMSITTIALYIKRALTMPWRYTVPPCKVLEVLGINLLINDEGHQHFHPVFMSVMHLDPQRVITLTASLVTKDKELASLYDVMYPPDDRLTNLVPFQAYAHLKAVSYSVDRPHVMKHVGPMGYNHNMLEVAIMSNAVLFEEYIALITTYVQSDYINRRADGQKLLVFCSTKKMCTLVTKYLQKLYGYLVVSRYVDEDPYSNIMDSDITVSTNLSASTGLDITGLINVLQTVSMDTMSGNIQAYGRLRDIPGVDVLYTCIFCKDIEPQVRYHSSRKAVLAGVTKTYELVHHKHTLETRK